MKVRLVEGLQLIITPENYVENVALEKWVETHKGAGGLLIEVYAKHSVTYGDFNKNTTQKTSLALEENTN